MKSFLQSRCYPVFLCIFLFLAYGFSSEFQEIERTILNKEYQKAKGLLENLIRQRPSEPNLKKSQYYLGLMQLNLGEYTNAEKTFSELTNAVSKNSELYEKATLGLADAYYFQEQYQQTISYLEKLLSRSPKSDFSSLIYLKLAKTNLRLAQWLKARKYLNKIVTEYPFSMENELAQQLLQEKHFFAVQVGSFSVRERAESLIAELKKKGQYAYIVELVDKNGIKYYRVRIGQLSKLNEAQDLKRKLSELGYPARIYP